MQIFHFVFRHVIRSLHLSIVVLNLQFHNNNNYFPSFHLRTTRYNSAVPCKPESNNAIVSHEANYNNWTHFNLA